MNIFFVGSTVDEETLKELSDASVAGNKMQAGFVKGFAKNKANVSCISVKPYAMWRFNKKPIYVKETELDISGIPVKAVSYFNIPIIKQISIYFAIFKELNKQLKKHKGEVNVVMVYNTMSFFALPVLKAARKFKAHAVSIVADLPIKFHKNIIRRYEDKLQEDLIGRFDALIPLTEYIQKDFAPETPYCVVEAGCDPDKYADIKNNYDFGQSDSLNVVFSGTLNLLSGIESAIKVFEKITNKNIVLHIFGDGEYKLKVINAAENNSNIRYHGRVDNDTMLKIQSSADLLICPRAIDDYTTKYTFPSKVLEYICSSVPVISNRLPGIPSEYENYINFTEDESEQSWIDLIEQVLIKEKDYYIEKATNAKAIVMDQKSWNHHCKSTYSFLEDCFGKR